jgi:hypothetical protein
MTIICNEMEHFCPGDEGIGNLEELLAPRESDVSGKTASTA